MSGKIVQLRQPKKYRKATSRAKGRQGNDAYRVREHLTEAEMDKLLTAAHIGARVQQACRAIRGKETGRLPRCLLLWRYSNSPQQTNRRGDRRRCSAVSGSHLLAQALQAIVVAPRPQTRTSDNGKPGGPSSPTPSPAVKANQRQRG